MKKIENSFYEQMILWKKKININKINKFIKDNLWITPLVYLIGTIALLIRNKMLGLQFVPISLLQFSIIFVYTIIFLILYSFVELNYIVIFNMVKERKFDFSKLIGYILLHFLYLVLVFLFIYFLTDNEKITLQLIFCYYFFVPVFIIFFNNKDFISNITAIIFIITLIINIPISVGGLKGQEIIYHSFEKDEKIEYIYYGNYDGLYQFIKDDNVLLIPIEDGYIEYKK